MALRLNGSLCVMPCLLYGDSDFVRLHSMSSAMAQLCKSRK
jgi:hypothetical protein